MSGSKTLSHILESKRIDVLTASNVLFLAVKRLLRRYPCDEGGKVGSFSFLRRTIMTENFSARSSVTSHDLSFAGVPPGCLGLVGWKISVDFAVSHVEIWQNGKAVTDWLLTAERLYGGTAASRERSFCDATFSDISVMFKRR